MATVTTADLFTLATSIPYAQNLASIATNANNSVEFLAFNETFSPSILGPNVSSTLLANETYQAFHEAGVYYKDTDSAYISSNYFKSNETYNTINVTIYNFATDTVSSANYPNLLAANGGTLFIAPNNSSPATNGLVPNKHYVLFADEGDYNGPSQLIAVDPITNTTVPLLTNFFGRNFSALNDVKQHPVTGDLWFTDAAYSYLQFFDYPPSIPRQVYRFDPSTGVLQAVADGFVQANGIEFSPDLKTLYVTDTGQSEFSNETAILTLPATIYAFDVNKDMKSVSNRRLFAYVDKGFPDGIHADTMGNVYAGCGDGIHVWNPEGVLLGKMLLSSVVNNFEFIPGAVLIFNGYKLYKVDIAAEGREVRREWRRA